MKKSYLLIAALLTITEILVGQVAQKVVVEHFTNTRCGICASRNPSFFENLSNQENVLHLSIHPSSPYSSCVLNKHNVSENDARTHYYSVYGGTPKLVIQGQAIPASTNYGSSSIFSDVANQTSPFSIEVRQSKTLTAETINIEIVVKAVAEHNLTNASLFVALAEDTVFYNAPNGENEHYDVFRKALTEVTGDEITLPTEVGEEVFFEFSAPAHEDWDFSRIFATVILQETASRAVIQSEATKASDETINIPTNIEQFSAVPIKVYPNPANNTLTVEAINGTNGQISILDLAGKIVSKQAFNQKVSINITDLPIGQYFLHLESEEGKTVTKFLKK